MAFESLSDRFQGILKKLKGQSKLTEANMDEMLKEIRVAVELNASDYKKYRYDGVYLLAYDVYGCRELAYLILALNGIFDPKEFTMNPIYLIRKTSMLRMLEAIKNAESDYIKINREQVGQ